MGVSPQKTPTLTPKAISSDYSLFPQEKKVYLKTGTLKGVYNLVGYITKDKIIPFVS